MSITIENIVHRNIDSISIPELEYLIDQYPYFQSIQTLYLKKLYSEDHYKYNNALKKTAAHTIDRTILFEFINTLNVKETVQSNTNLSIEKEITEDNLQQITESINKPLPFSKEEKLSFNEWLKLSVNAQPIHRETPQEEKTKQATPPPIKTKLKAIDKFINSNPKIERIKRENHNPTTNPKVVNNISNELMTETLAKVYVAQKKYKEAIQAYHILSLKYPEKSSLFANQIERIKIFQNHKL